MFQAFPFKELWVALGGFALGAAVIGLLFARRYSLRPKSGKFAGVEYDISRFADITAVKFFAHVTRMALPASESAAFLHEGHDPVALIYAGWTLVSDAFVRKYGVFPTDENVMKAIQTLGPQNADFIKTYRAIQESAVRNADKVTLVFAQEYASRAPHLAQRIEPAEWAFEVSLASQLLSRLPPVER